MQYLPQNISIELPCKPFMLSGQKIDGLDLHLYFEPVESLVCPECGEGAVIHAKKVSKRPLQSVAIGPYQKVFWHVANRRGWCPHCEYTFTEAIPFQFLGRHVTLDLAKKICDEMDESSATIRATAKRLSISEDLVRRVHGDFLDMVIARVPEPQGVESIAVDEFSILKGHKYATMIISLDPRQVLFLCEGRTGENVDPFFSCYSKEFYEGIECVAMDQNHTYASQFKEKMPHVTIVSDRFHMSSNYTKDVVDRVRLRVARSYKERGDNEGYKLFKQSKYRLFTPRLADPSQAESEQELQGQLQLQKLLGMNEDINSVVLMFEQLRALYEISDENVMRKQWEGWLQMAEQSGIPELVKFAQKKRRYTDQIVAHAKYPVTSAVIEGMFNVVKVQKRAAFGYRNFEYFFKRIQYVFIPALLKEKIKRDIWKNCSQYLLDPLYHAKCG